MMIDDHLTTTHVDILPAAAAWHVSYLLLTVVRASCNHYINILCLSCWFMPPAQGLCFAAICLSVYRRQDYSKS